MWDLTGDLSLIMIQAINVHVCMLMTYTSRGFPSHTCNSLCCIHVQFVLPAGKYKTKVFHIHVIKGADPERVDRVASHPPPPPFLK